jgi:hypothetical protein
VVPGFRSHRSTAPRVRTWAGARRALPALLSIVLLGACAADPAPKKPPQVSPSATSLIGGGGLTRPTALPSGSLPKCDFPARVASPKWLPRDLPFPAGTYTMQEVPVASGFHRALLVVPGDLSSLAAFVLEQWPKSGYLLGRGDAEFGEIEDLFTKAPSVGAFKAVSVLCDPGYAKMLFIFAEQSPGLPVLPTPSGSALNPSGT